MIKVRPGYCLRTVLDQHLILGEGAEAYRPSCLMSVNSSGAFLWGLLEQGSERDDLVRELTEEFSVSPETAEQDVDRFLTQLEEKALIFRC